MKRFTFSLQAVLTLREQQEHTALDRYARSLRQCEQIGRSHQAASDELERGWTLLQTAMAAGARATRLVQIRSFCRDRNERKLCLERDLAAALEIASRDRQSVLEAARNREVLDRYRQRRHRAYEYEVARAEQKVMDDLAARPTTLAGAWRRPGSAPPI